MTFGSVYIAGHRGLVGSALLRDLQKHGYRNIIVRTHNELDLRNTEKVREFFATNKPDAVVVAAARVGGIKANNDLPVEFLLENLQIQNNLISASFDFGVKKLLFLGSSCIYPRLAVQPIKEETLLTGALEPTNEPYAIAKIAGIKLCQAYARQHGANFISVMPTNLYGPGDNFDLQTSHVLPALIRKVHEAKMQNRREVVIWGTGTPRREFLHTRTILLTPFAFSWKTTTRRKLLTWAAATTSQSGSWRCWLPKWLGSTRSWFSIRQNRTAHHGSSWISVVSGNWAGNQGSAWKMEFGTPINGFWAIRERHVSKHRFSRRSVA